ncbi:MAG: hypothetical protein M1831_007397 [Alyxoria varia]|nr:MAG: hypothetical protein M1831_007397 [Alyxoria varia]
MSEHAKDGVAASFTKMIQDDRKKKRNTELANQILGSGRRSSAPGAVSNRRGGGPNNSLASRVGVQKVMKPGRPTGRPTSNHHFNYYNSKPANGPAPRQNTNSRNARDVTNLSYLRGSGGARGGRTASHLQIDRRNRLANAVEQDVAVNGTSAQFNIRGGPQASGLGGMGAGMNIRGMASNGPFTVIASNFAPGTTARDVESAMAPIGQDILGCVLLADVPTVIAELVFAKREGAENVIATFNNQRADGRLLYVYMKGGGPSLTHGKTFKPTPVSQKPASRASPSSSNTPTINPGLTATQANESHILGASREPASEPAIPDSSSSFPRNETSSQTQQHSDSGRNLNDEQDREMMDVDQAPAPPTGPSNSRTNGRGGSTRPRDDYDDRRRNDRDYNSRGRYQDNRGYSGYSARDSRYDRGPRQSYGRDYRSGGMYSDRMYSSGGGRSYGGR